MFPWSVSSPGQVVDMVPQHCRQMMSKLYKNVGCLHRFSAEYSELWNSVESETFLLLKPHGISYNYVHSYQKDV